MKQSLFITDVAKVVQTLNSLCVEMDTRYDLLKAAHVRNIKEYNEKFINRRLNPEKGAQVSCRTSWWSLMSLATLS